MTRSSPLDAVGSIGEWSSGRRPCCVMLMVVYLAGDYKEVLDSGMCDERKNPG